jgi:hypothetical protein
MNHMMGNILQTLSLMLGGEMEELVYTQRRELKDSSATAMHVSLPKYRL